MLIIEELRHKLSNVCYFEIGIQLVKLWALENLFGVTKSWKSAWKHIKRKMLSCS